jgi:hypothetical protein
MFPLYCFEVFLYDSRLPLYRTLSSIYRSILLYFFSISPLFPLYPQRSFGVRQRKRLAAASRPLPPDARLDVASKDVLHQEWVAASLLSGGAGGWPRRDKWTLRLLQRRREADR